MEAGANMAAAEAASASPTELHCASNLHKAGGPPATPPRDFFNLLFFFSSLVFHRPKLTPLGA